jgi:hypothetical protein
MAQSVQTLLIDDLDGGEAEGTVRFGLDGAEYVIDLNAKHAEALRKALGPYVKVARRASGPAVRRPGRSGRRAAHADGTDSLANNDPERLQIIKRCVAGSDDCRRSDNLQSLTRLIKLARSKDFG